MLFTAKSGQIICFLYTYQRTDSYFTRKIAMFYISLIYIYSIDSHNSADFYVRYIHIIDKDTYDSHNSAVFLTEMAMILAQIDYFYGKNDQIYPQVSHYIARLHMAGVPLNGFQHRVRCGQSVQVRTQQKAPVKFISINITDGRPIRDCVSR